MVKIRLSRHGAKKNPFYWVVVTEKSKARNGQILEKLGTYIPKEKDDSKKLKINVESLKVWQSKGAVCTETVYNLIKTIPQV